MRSRVAVGLFRCQRLTARPVRLEYVVRVQQAQLLYLRQRLGLLSGGVARRSCQGGQLLRWLHLVQVGLGRMNDPVQVAVSREYWEGAGLHDQAG